MQSNATTIAKMQQENKKDSQYQHKSLQDMEKFLNRIGIKVVCLFINSSSVSEKTLVKLVTKNNVINRIG